MARRALQKAMHYSGLYLYAPISFDRRGAPKPQRGIHFTLTHKQQWAGALVGRCRLGFDVEKLRRIRLRRTFEHIANTKEWALFQSRNQTENFFRVWTAKEAVLKAIGTGLRDLSRCHLVHVTPRRGSTARLTLSCKGRRWHVLQHFFKGHLASLTLTSPRQQVRWHFEDLA